MACREMPFYVSSFLESIGAIASFIWLPKLMSTANDSDSSTSVKADLGVDQVSNVYARPVGASIFGEESCNELLDSSQNVATIASPRTQSITRFPQGPSVF